MQGHSLIRNLISKVELIVKKEKAHEVICITVLLGAKAHISPEHFRAQFEFLADEIWPHFAYGKNAVYSSGHHGNAILSKYPFTAYENVDITMSRFAKRGLLHGVIDVMGPKQPLHSICLHLDLSQSKRIAQAQRLVDRIQEYVPLDCPLIIAGDFNDWEQGMTEYLQQTLQLKEVFREMTGKHARTFPSRLPALKLDRIYFRGLKVLKAKRFAKAPWKKLSDHLALYAELKLIGHSSATRPTAARG